jgi:hypothetical protein
MLHIIQENEHSKLDLNLRGSLKSRWIAVIWYWYNPAAFTEHGWYILLRAHFSPHLVVKKLDSVTVIDRYLNEHKLMLVEDRGIL